MMYPTIFVSAEAIRFLKIFIFWAQKLLKLIFLRFKIFFSKLGKNSIYRSKLSQKIDFDSKFDQKLILDSKLGRNRFWDSLFNPKSIIQLFLAQKSIFDNKKLAKL